MKRLSDGKNLKPLFQFCVCFHNNTFMAQHIQSLLILFHPTQNLSLVCPFSFHIFFSFIPSFFLPNPTPNEFHGIYRVFDRFFCADDGTVYRITSCYIYTSACILAMCIKNIYIYIFI